MNSLLLLSGRGIKSLALIGLTAGSIVGLRGQDTNTTVAEPAPAAITTATSSNYSEVTCTSSDALANDDALRLAADTRDQLGGVLNLGRAWRFAVHIHIMMPDDPLLAKVDREAAAVFADDKGMRIEAVLPSTDPDARAFIQRQYVTALLWEKFFATTQTFDVHTKLDVVPMWLVEGLREWLNEDPAHDRESIVRKAVETGRAPSLAEVTGWQKLSTDKLMGLWQRSFCFYIVNSLILPGQRRTEFQQWLATFAGPNPTSAQLLFPTEAGWQRELADATERSKDIVYSWDETLQQLTATEVIPLPKAAGSKSCTLDTVASCPRDPELIATLHQKITDLTSLELRAHPAWRPVLALYRFGLNALVDEGNPGKAMQLLNQAHDLRMTETANHQKLIDYMNWFEVTKDYASTSSRFQSYFSTAREMERVQADPAHPNPIRANLLLIESEL